MTVIPDYTCHIITAARFLKQGEYIGIGFAFAGVTNDVAHACMTGREPECGKFAFKEYAKFGAGTTLGLWGGGMGSSAGLGACVAVGIATAGAGGVACAVVGSLAGGYLGSKFGEYSSEKIFELMEY